LHHVGLASLVPPFAAESSFLDEMLQTAKSGKWRMLQRIIDQAFVLGKLRECSVLGAVPNVPNDDLRNIGQLAEGFGVRLDPSYAERLDEADMAMRSLNLEYLPSMPVQQYLDIVIPRKEKIAKLLNRLLESDADERGRRVKTLNDEIWKINREISASRTLETISFMTDFATDNMSIIFGMLAGGLLGYTSASFVGCGLGAGVGGGSLGAASRLLKKPLRVRKVPRRTAEWIAAKLESPKEKLMSLLLAKDITTIQVYQLRRKLKRIQ